MQGRNEDTISLMDFSANGDDLILFDCDTVSIQPAKTPGVKPKSSAKNDVDLLLLNEDKTVDQTEIQDLREEIKQLNIKLEKTLKEIDSKDRTLDKKDNDMLQVCMKKCF